MKETSYSIHIFKKFPLENCLLSLPSVHAPAMDTSLITACRILAAVSRILAAASCCQACCYCCKLALSLHSCCPVARSCPKPAVLASCLCLECCPFLPTGTRERECSADTISGSRSMEYLLRLQCRSVTRTTKQWLEPVWIATAAAAWERAAIPGLAFYV